MKKTIISVVIILIMLIYPAANGYVLVRQINTDGYETATDAEIIYSLAKGDVAKVQKKISDMKIPVQTDPTMDILTQIDSGEITYRYVLRNVCIAGDSLMNGLESYNILSSNNLITQVSASLYHLSDNSKKIIGMKPEILIVHYGLNMLETDSGQPARFITFYKKILTKLIEELPDTRIIVSSIFPVDTSKARAARFKRIDEYNQALKEMCAELDIEYLDNSNLIGENKDLYAYDGIHLDRAFYENYWLRAIVKEKGIVG